MALKKLFYENVDHYTSADGESVIGNIHFLVFGIYTIVKDIKLPTYWLAKLRLNGSYSVVAERVDNEEEFNRVMEVLGYEDDSVFELR